MSIAVSALVRPSRWLAVLCWLMSAVLCMTTFSLWAAVADAAMYAIDYALVIVCASASLALALFPLLCIKTLHIDVSRTGQIRLPDTSPESATDRSALSDNCSEVVQLLRDSTLWSWLMVLRLQSVTGNVKVVYLLPDCMDRESFLALSVACRWIANSHAHPASLSSYPAPAAD